MSVRSASLLQRRDDIPTATARMEDRLSVRRDCWPAVFVLGPVLITVRDISSPAAYSAWKHPMFTDAAILLGLGFAAGYGLRAWISARRRRAIRKARGD